MKTRLLITLFSLLVLIPLPLVYAPVPFVDDDTFVDKLEKNQLPIGHGVYMDFTFFLVLLGGGVVGIIFAIRRKRK